MDRFPNYSRVSALVALTLVSITLTGCKLDTLFKSAKSDPVPALDRIEMSPNSVYHGDIWMTSANSAIQKAASENKLVMALFTGSDWCSYCVKLEKEVFESPEFHSWADKNYVALKLDFPRKTELPADLREQNQAMLARYREHVKGYPTVLFLDNQGQVVGKIGYSRGGPEQWIAKADGAITR